MKKIRIVHIINSFQFGGAEAMLCSLLERTDLDRFDPHVVALIDDMTVAGPVINMGLSIEIMGMKPGIPDPRGITRLAKYLKKMRPDVVQTWMDHSNLIGGAASWLAGVPHVVWGIHHSEHVAGLTKRSTLLTVGACARLSRRLPSRIVFCSEHAKKLYTERGFAEDRQTVIPNGFDTARFRACEDARAGIRKELRVDPNATVIGLVARYDPLKDHANFIEAAGLLKGLYPDVHFLMCGANVDSDNTLLVEQIRSLGLADRVHLLGPRSDVQRIHASLDIATSASLSEAFPLVVGEAMACGVPCVATDVGDSSLIVGESGRIVPPRDPAALARGWSELLAMPVESRRNLGQQARHRVCELFDLAAVTRRYESVYAELVEPGQALALNGVGSRSSGERRDLAIA